MGQVTSEISKFHYTGIWIIICAQILRPPCSLQAELLTRTRFLTNSAESLRQQTAPHRLTIRWFVGNSWIFGRKKKKGRRGKGREKTFDRDRRIKISGKKDETCALWNARHGVDVGEKREGKENGFTEWNKKINTSLPFHSVIRYKRKRKLTCM